MLGLPVVVAVLSQAPSSWACSVETLSAGRECVFDVRTAPSTDTRAQERHNIELARELAPALCTDAPPSSPEHAACAREIAAASRECGLGGKRPLVDARGRFTEGSRACYRGLARVVQALAVTSALIQCRLPTPVPTQESPR